MTRKTTGARRRIVITGLCAAALVCACAPVPRRGALNAAPLAAPAPSAPAVAAAVPADQAGRLALLARLRPILEIQYVSSAVKSGGSKGSGLVTTGGGSLVTTGGGSLVTTGGGSLVTTGGGSLVTTGGGSLVTTGSGSVVSNGGAGYALRFGLATAADPNDPAIARAPLPGEEPPVIQRYPDGTEDFYFRTETGGRSVLVRARNAGVRESAGSWRKGDGTVIGEILTRVEKFVVFDAWTPEGRKPLPEGFVTLRRSVETAYTPDFQKWRTTIRDFEMRDPGSGARLVGEELIVDTIAGNGRYSYAYPSLGYREHGEIDRLPMTKGIELNYGEPLQTFGGRATIEDATGRVLFRKVHETANNRTVELRYELDGETVVAYRDIIAGVIYTGELRVAGRVVGSVLTIRDPNAVTPAGFSVTFDRAAMGIPEGEPNFYLARLEAGGMAFSPVVPVAVPVALPSPAPSPRQGGPYEAVDWYLGTMNGAPVGGEAGSEYRPPIALEGPRGVALDPEAGMLYVTEQTANRVSRIDLETGAVTVVAGSGERLTRDGQGLAASFNGPEGIAFDAPRRRLIVSEVLGQTIRAVTLDGEVTTLAGDGRAGATDGPASRARFDTPTGVAVAPDGTVFVADTNNHRIRRIAPSGAVSTVAGGPIGFRDGPGRDARFSSPAGLALAPDGDLVVAEIAGNRIRRIDSAGRVRTWIGDGTPGREDAPVARVSRPWGLAVDDAGHALFVGPIGSDLRRVGPDGRSLTLVGGAGAGSIDGLGSGSSFDSPYAVAVRPDGSAAYVIEPTTGHVRIALPWFIEP